MPEPKLLDQVRQTARLKHVSLRTERAYAQWVYGFVVYHGKRHPREMGAREIQAFLTWLAVERDVAASTQNEALCALLFLYREVLGGDLPRIEDTVRAPAFTASPHGAHPRRGACLNGAPGRHPRAGGRACSTVVGSDCWTRCACA